LISLIFKFFIYSKFGIEKRNKYKCSLIQILALEEEVSPLIHSITTPIGFENFGGGGNIDNEALYKLMGVPKNAT
jgi:hypothetical protein